MPLGRIFGRWALFYQNSSDTESRKLAQKLDIARRGADVARRGFDVARRRVDVAHRRVNVARRVVDAGRRRVDAGRREILIVLLYSSTASREKTIKSNEMFLRRESNAPAPRVGMKVTFVCLRFSPRLFLTER